MNDALWLLEYVRENILEKFMLPQLDISYWDFLIYLALASIVIVVLVNKVRLSAIQGDNARANIRYKQPKTKETGLVVVDNNRGMRNV